MYGIASNLAFDVALAAHEEKIARAELARLVRSANGAHGNGIFAAIRRALGGALIAAGQSVRGKRAEALDHTHATLPSTGALRLAR